MPLDATPSLLLLRVKGSAIPSFKMLWGQTLSSNHRFSCYKGRKGVQVIRLGDTVIWRVANVLGENPSWGEAPVKD